MRLGARALLPRAGLLGSLTAIALAIISFLPLLDIAAYPVAGFVALAVILATLTARWRLPRNMPGALGAVLLGCLVYYGMHLAGLGPGLGAEGAQPSSLLAAGAACTNVCAGGNGSGNPGPRW